MGVGVSQLKGEKMIVYLGNHLQMDTANFRLDITGKGDTRKAGCVVSVLTW